MPRHVSCHETQSSRDSCRNDVSAATLTSLSEWTLLSYDVTFESESADWLAGNRCARVRRFEKIYFRDTFNYIRCNMLCYGALKNIPNSNKNDWIIGEYLAKSKANITQKFWSKMPGVRAPRQNPASSPRFRDRVSSFISLFSYPSPFVALKSPRSPAGDAGYNRATELGFLVGRKLVMSPGAILMITSMERNSRRSSHLPESCWQIAPCRVLSSV